MTTEAIQQSLKYIDLWNPERDLSLGEFYRLRESLKDDATEIYRKFKHAFDLLDHIYLQVVIKPNKEMFSVFAWHLERTINDLKLIDPKVKTRQEMTVEHVLYKRASFLKWKIKEYK